MPKKCKNCDSKNIRQSKPRELDRLIMITGISPYRCKSCQQRFWAWA